MTPTQSRHSSFKPHPHQVQQEFKNTKVPVIFALSIAEIIPTSVFGTIGSIFASKKSDLIESVTIIAIAFFISSHITTFLQSGIHHCNERKRSNIIFSKRLINDIKAFAFDNYSTIAGAMIAGALSTWINTTSNTPYLTDSVNTNDVHSLSNITAVQEHTGDPSINVNIDTDSWVESALLSCLVGTGALIANFATFQACRLAAISIYALKNLHKKHAVNKFAFYR
jgi:hypothetical protein